jgi:hypothetical protein
MFDKPYRGSTAAQGLATISLVTTITCALAKGALASPAPVEANAELSARVAALVERISLGEPTRAHNVPPERKIVQWRN